MVISKMFMHKSKVIFEGKVGEIEIMTFDEYQKCSKDNLINNNVINLITEENERYFIKNQKTAVLCNLDKYFYATLLRGEVI